MDVIEIDGLLERYLQLLHEYTTLRAELGSLHTGIYQNIARANFSAERGMRFGQDFYDDRMQASRRLETAVDKNGILRSRVANIDRPEHSVAEEATHKDDAKDDDVLENRSEGLDKAPKPVISPKRKDPLRWFGLLTPLPIRQAQSQSIKVVEHIIPRLVSINSEMQQVEIEVRRARKKRAKAEAVSKKQEEDFTVREL